MLDLRFSDRHEEDQFCSFLLAQRKQTKWWDVMRSLTALSALLKLLRVWATGQQSLGVDAFFFITCPLNIVESYVAQTELGSWRTRAALGALTGLLNVTVTALAYEIVFDTTALTGWQLFCPAMAGSFWVFFHMQRLGPVLPFHLHYLYQTVLAFICLLRLPDVCASSNSLRWLAAGVFRVAHKVCGMVGLARAWPSLARLLGDETKQCVVVQTFMLMCLGYLWSAYLTFTSELRLRKAYVREKYSRSVAKRLIGDAPSTQDFFYSFALPPLACMLLFLLHYDTQ